jgi:hypothetical protein
MAKLYVQNAPVVLEYASGSLAANGASSASLLCAGYSQLRGLFYSDVITETGSGLQISQSMDGGSNFLYTSASDVISACAVTPCIVDIVGDAIKVDIRNGVTAGSNVRWKFYLLPSR